MLAVAVLPAAATVRSTQRVVRAASRWFLDALLCYLSADGSITVPPKVPVFTCIVVIGRFEHGASEGLVAARANLPQAGRG